MIRSTTVPNDAQAAGALLPEPGGPLTIGSVPPAERIQLSVVIPTYNERCNIEPLVERLTAVLNASLREGSYELIVVDDDSPDETWRRAEEISGRFPQLRVMRRTRERGLSSAVIRGWQAARGETLGVIDADLQHPPEVIGELWKEIQSGADLAVGSRHVPGGGVSDWKIRRRILSRGAQLLGMVVLPEVVGRVSDPMSGYFLVKRTAIAGRPMSPVGYKILIETLGRGTVRWIAETPYTFRERSDGQSKVTAKVYVEYLLHLVRLRFTIASRFFRFAVVGASGTVVDMGMLYLLSEPATLGLSLVPSKLAAAEIAIINNFLWNDAWTFHDLTEGQNSLRHKLKRMLKSNIVFGLGLAINVSVFWIQCEWLEMNRYIANAVAIGCATGWNYLVSLKFGWRSAVSEKR